MPCHSLATKKSVAVVISTKHAGKATAIDIHILHNLSTFTHADAAFCSGRLNTKPCFQRSMQIPSGYPSRAAQTRRFVKVPSSSMVKAVRHLPCDSAMMRVLLSAVTAMPFGNAILSATCRTEGVGSDQHNGTLSAVNVDVSTAHRRRFHSIRDSRRLPGPHAWPVIHPPHAEAEHSFGQRTMSKRPCESTRN